MIAVIGIIKLRRYKSSNIQCWPLPGTVRLANNLFSRTVYFFVVMYTQEILHFLKTSRGDRSVVICRHL